METQSAANTKQPPRIYVACLSAYNNGHLHGTWITVTDADGMAEQIEAMLAESPEPGAEEWAIHDHENFFGIEIGEHESLEDIAKIGELLEEHGALFAQVLNHHGRKYLDEAVTDLEENYQGAYDSIESWAEQFLQDTGAFVGANELLVTYFDLESYARDAELGGDIYTIDSDDGRVHVFFNR